jgi:hypothetical protein
MIDSCPKEANVGTILPLELLDLWFLWSRLARHMTILNKLDEKERKFHVPAKPVLRVEPVGDATIGSNECPFARNGSRTISWYVDWIYKSLKNFDGVLANPPLEPAAMVKRPTRISLFPTANALTQLLQYHWSLKKDGSVKQQ